MKNFQQWNGNPTGSEVLILLFVILGINAFLITTLTDFFTISFLQTRFIVIDIIMLASVLFAVKLVKEYWKNRK